MSSSSINVASIPGAFRPVNTPASIRRVDAPSPLRDIVRRARDERGMTQAQLAEALEMSQRWVSALENDDIEAPRMKTLRRLATVLQLDLTTLVIGANLARTRAEARRLIVSEPNVADDGKETMNRVIRLMGRVDLERYDRLGQLEDQLKRWIRYDNDHPEGV